jgi:hypothetical protein
MRLLATIFAASITFTAHADPYERGDNPWLAKQLTKAELLPAMTSASDYLVRNQLADGQFIYIKDPLGKCCRDKADKYSLIRHLGGVYAMLRTHQHAPDQKYLAAAKAGIDFVLRFRADYSGAQIVYGMGDEVSIGENGFLLIDTVLYDQLTGGDTYKQVSSELAKFVAGALRYDGKFATSGQWAESQALIGLMMYAHATRVPGKVDQTFLSWIEPAREWLTEVMQNKKYSHWSVQAIDWYGRVAPDPDPALLSYGVKASEKLLDNVVTAGMGGKARLIGSRGGKFGSCGVTARNEGLIAAYNVAMRLGKPAEARLYKARIREHLAHAMQFQFGMEGNIYEKDPRWTRLARLFDMNGGVFNTPRTGFVRVDYVSHHVRAMAAFLEGPGKNEEVGLSIDELAHPTAH